jgi:hypothetical protein
MSSSKTALKAKLGFMPACADAGGILMVASLYHPNPPALQSPSGELGTLMEAAPQEGNYTPEWNARVTANLARCAQRSFGSFLFDPIATGSARAPNPAAIKKMVLAESLRMAAWGIPAGLLLLAATAWSVRSMVLGVTPLDPLTYVTSAAAAVVVALTAAWLPARRATQVDPMSALRSE